MISAQSVKMKLKSQANRDGTTMQNKLITYALERTIYRISVSTYSNRFTLKGGIFLYAIFDKNFSRATLDIDLLAQNITSDINSIQSVFTEILSIEVYDALFFDLSSLYITSITEFKEYHGINISITTFLEKTKIPVSIDIGFDDVIHPERVLMDFPVLLDMDTPKIYAYSIYSVIAEKFEAFVSIGLINSRYKDYYDIYIIANKFNLNGHLLKEAIIETFNHRNTQLNDIATFDENFISDSMQNKRWNAFIKKKKAIENIFFAEAMNIIMKLLMPVVQSIYNNKAFNKNWIAENKNWI
ncbi:MAG: nucleotidyl transferase AbiEii/AbiGii toxin family protein [Lachnospiraceae bacterium]|jgi:predicted nucleotidyltransferase component of viral defense system|nr:nucleotidyl transferase AbiEii/AbiGii toxin family protein [Lachnospiraceae bacterium]